MTVTIQISATLRAYCRAPRSQFAVSASTVGEALRLMANTHPAIYHGICNETGAIRQHVHLFVNNDFIHDREGLDTPLAPGDVLSLMPAVSGG